MSLIEPDRPGFFIPYRHAADVVPCAYPVLEPLFRAAQDDMIELLRKAETFAELFRTMQGPPPLPRFDQEWFPRLDAVAAYTFVRDTRPARIVEIGSGHSTRFMACAIRDAGLATELICIDPKPRADIAALPLRHEPRRLEELDTAALASMLAPGDVLFVDSSHLAIPGCDVDRVVNDLLPRLARGVLVHVHDIFLPDPYPPEWSWRGYAEQSLIAPLLHGGGWKLLWSSHWLATRQKDCIVTSPLGGLPLRPGVFESSIWLTRRA